ncbi:MAG: DDE-type integrase/transposase/recombinase [Chloroflexi bacterium]|nr:DDE-type integrase/transposase/recombinase [Chloroflexota bacterium]MBU1750980.1 DDE-type integrase/transposase/recombinase [Chloroflexota bacterium]
MFYRLRTAKDVVVIVLTLLAFGCPVQAIVMAFGLDERTVVSWQERGGQHCHQVHQHWVVQPRDLGQVQADEIRVKVQGGIVWLAQAMQVRTRLWLGGVLGVQRDSTLIAALIQQVRGCALCRPLLFCVDGCATYVSAIQKVFREPVHTRRAGRPRLRPWDGIAIAQVLKQYAQKRVVDVKRRVVQGTAAQVQALLRQAQGGGTINTAYIERLNATFRARMAALVRRSRALARQTDTLHAAMYLVGTVYNFCTYHESLRVPLYLPRQRHRWVQRTPATNAVPCGSPPGLQITSGL